MNLQAIASPVIAFVNPPVSATWQVATGYTTNPDGTRASGYQFYTVTMQVQSLSGTELRLMDGLNIQGVLRAAYLNGAVEGADRRAGKGGDIFSFNTQTWKVVHVLEPWDAAGWCKVVLALQTDT